MFRIMMQKLWHKKWMVICLLLGSTMLIATVVSYPMYKNAVFDRMLQDEFDQSLEENATWPTQFSLFAVAKHEPNSSTIERMEQFSREVYDELNVPEKESVFLYRIVGVNATSMMNRSDVDVLSLKIGFMSNLENHTKMLSGEQLSESGLTEEGYVEAVISQDTLVDRNLLVGECIKFESVTTPDGSPLIIKIVGVYAGSDKNDFYWKGHTTSLRNCCLIRESVFRDYFMGLKAEDYTLNCEYTLMLDYSYITESMLDSLVAETNYLSEESVYRQVVSEPDYLTLIEGYESKRDRIETTLFILQVPVLLLLCAFLLMLSSQMYELEKNEISIMKSRGGASGQVFRLYLYQSFFLTAIGILFGIPLGSVFCRILGSADNFLEFGITRKLVITYKLDVWLYCLAAAAVSVLIMTIPSLRHSKLSIVKLKQQNAIKKRPLWEKCFLDLIFIGIALYSYYNYSENTDSLVQRVLEGKPLDPLLYISSTLFILGMGMLLLRLQPLLAKLLFFLGKKRWKPGIYASFREVIKNGRKQQFIMLFMILTIALGMFNAVDARTILQNALDNESYLDGTDITMQEGWSDNSFFVSMDSSLDFTYNEPDYSKYAELSGAQSYTKVLIDSAAYVTLGSKNRKMAVTVMGIQTKEFGQITSVKDSLLDEPYYQYLNDLAVSTNGVLLSSNFEKNLDYKIGDQVQYYSSDNTVTYGNVVGFFDYWPTYQPVTTTLSESKEIVETENYLLVTHLANLQSQWPVKPYQVWISLKEGENTDFYYDWVDKYEVPIHSYTDRTKEMQKVVEDPMLQGTNGVLTMSFIVMIILCAVGYLIYWIMSIRSREMMFGVLRAFGMHKEEVLGMLVLEQIFSGIYSILAGIGIGALASRMYVPMLQTAYAASDQVLPMTFVTQQSDMIRLYLLIAGVMVTCLLVLAILVSKLNVVKALKLGEE